MRTTSIILIITLFLAIAAQPALALGDKFYCSSCKLNCSDICDQVDCPCHEEEIGSKKAEAACVCIEESSSESETVGINIDDDEDEDDEDEDKPYDPTLALIGGGFGMAALIVIALGFAARGRTKDED